MVGAMSISLVYKKRIFVSDQKNMMPIVKRKGLIRNILGKTTKLLHTHRTFFIDWFNCAHWKPSLVARQTHARSLPDES